MYCKSTFVLKISLVRRLFVLYQDIIIANDLFEKSVQCRNRQLEEAVGCPKAPKKWLRKYIP